MVICIILLLIKNKPQPTEKEKELATHSSIVAWKIPWMEGLAGYDQWGCEELDMTERLALTQPTALITAILIIPEYNSGILLWLFVL